MICQENIRILPIISALFFFVNIMTFGQDGCVTDKCHTDMGKGEFVHGPVGAFICNVCHSPVEGEDHEFVFFAEKDELCFGCHETNRDMMLENHLHTPVSEGNCIGCHDPHQSDFRFTLKGTAAELCFQCHDQKQFTGDAIHGPVAVGDCNACHNPHASAYEKQLRESAPDLCISCHSEKTEEMNKKHIHSPVKENCMKCHDSHASAGKFLLEYQVPELCFGCHSELALSAESTYKHDPVANGQCNSCHDVHSSEHQKLFTSDPGQLCFSCHEEMGKYIGESTHKHGPIIEGDCNACHNPHGSEHSKILRKYFPDEFYMPYADENYDLCFECHARSVAMDEETNTLTEFRNFKQNLHYLHVNKQEKGRSCRACHQVHASSQEKHIRYSVPFGEMNWELPVTFTKNENGGNCVVGCHGPKEYKRK
jgi:predicted CXXCH cytochrome family protein